MNPFLDEYGFAFRLKTPFHERRRDSHGRTLGPKPVPEQEQSYDEKQIRAREADALTDLAGEILDGP